MKALEITMIPPSKNGNGGQRGIDLSIFSLAENVDVDYIGPQYEEDSYCDVLKTRGILLPDTSAVRRIWNLFRGITTAYYRDCMRVFKNLDWQTYKVVHIDSSRYYFLVKEAHRHGVKVIVRVHNIERDLARELARLEKTPLSVIQRILFSINERKVCQNADALVFLTKQDLDRAVELYDIDPDRAIINPSCLDFPEEPMCGYNPDIPVTVLFTGALNYAPNIEGVLWFYEDIWKKYRTRAKERSVRFVVAGFRPDSRVKLLEKEDDSIQVVDSPESMSPWFWNSDIYVAPVLHGAGIKVKVAEALSFGLPIIGTSHAWIGYENIKEGKTVADLSEDFLEALLKATEKKLQNEVRWKIRSEFRNHLSMESSMERYRMLLEKI